MKYLTSLCVSALLGTVGCKPAHTTVKSSDTPLALAESRVILTGEGSKKIFEILNLARVPDSSADAAIVTYVVDVQCTRAMSAGNPSDCQLQTSVGEKKIDGANAAALVEAIIQAEVPNGPNSVTTYIAKELTCTKNGGAAISTPNCSHMPFQSPIYQPSTPGG